MVAAACMMLRSCSWHGTKRFLLVGAHAIKRGNTCCEQK
jgi:hypothetical protein